MLTENQLEMAAREYCRIKGVDPDEMIKHGPDPIGSVVHSILLESPRWERVARILREQDIQRHCIKHAIDNTYARGAL